VQYTISLAHAETHLVHVHIDLPAGGSERELQLPVWNAVYEVRDFAQFVNWIKASTPAQPLPVVKLDKSRWRVSGAENGAAVDYEIFADQPGPYNAQLNSHHAFLNLAEILMYPVDSRAAPVTVRIADLPSGWRMATALKSTGAAYEAENYDRLVDSPIEIGSFQDADLDEGGGHYRIVVDADATDYDLQGIAGMIHRIVAAATAWMDDRPFQEYLFIYHFPREVGGGGMEHAFSTAIDVNAGVLRTQPAVLPDVTAHEFFHLWNVKRIRPQSLEPVDYTKEIYTPALWFSEGVTSTVSDYIQLRAGLLNEPRYLERLAAQIRQLQSRPAHLTQSAEESSLDTWLEKYPYYRLPARSISYYNKGELLGVLLDLELRETTQGRASLRDVFQWMNANFAQRGRFFPDSPGVRQAAEAVCHCDLGTFFISYVTGTDELPYDRLFATVGLRLDRQTITIGDAGFTATRDFGAAPVVTTVQAAGRAAHAGLAVGDSIVEINGQPSGPDFDDRLNALRPDDVLRLKVRGAAGEREIRWKVAGKPELEFQLKEVDNITPQQKARRAAWLRGESQGDAHP
jgi:predicted metalloprotease with PDZ domain